MFDGIKRFFSRKQRENKRQENQHTERFREYIRVTDEVAKLTENIISHQTEPSRDLLALEMSYRTLRLDSISIKACSLLPNYYAPLIEHLDTLVGKMDEAYSKELRERTKYSSDFYNGCWRLTA